MKSTSESPQVRLTRKLPAYCRVVFDNPPLNLMGPERTYFPLDQIANLRQMGFSPEELQSIESSNAIRLMSRLQS